MATAPGDNTRFAASMVITVAPVTTRATGWGTDDA
jgi:hypothetical protein